MTLRDRALERQGVDRTLFVLREIAEEGYTSPSDRLLCETTGYVFSTVYKHLKTLERAGLVEREIVRGRRVIHVKETT